MQIGMVNKAATERYRRFVGAMDLVLESLDGVDRIIRRVKPRAGAGGWTAATPAELKALRNGAFKELDQLRSIAKKHEAELVSREWRV